MTSPRKRLRSLTRTSEDIASLHAHGLWRNRTLGDLLRHHASSRPDTVALVHDGRMITYRQYWDQVSSLASSLISRGVRPGDRAVIMLPNWPEFPITRLALSECGAVSIIVNAANSDEELQATIEGTRASIVIAPLRQGRRSFSELLAKLAGRLGADRVLVAGETDVPVGTPLAPLLSDGEVNAPEGVSFVATRNSADDIDDVMFTSGTTGRPKGVMGCQNRWLSMCGNQRRAGGMGYTDTGVVLSPVGGTIGYLKSTVLALVTGSRVILVDRIDPDAVWDLIAREQATYVVSVPTITHRLMTALTDADAKRERKREFPHLRMFFHGGAPMSRTLAEDVRERLGCFLLTSMGSTESGAVVGSHLGDTHEMQVATTGSAYPGSTIAVMVDSERRSVGVGELVSRCSASFAGYLDDPAATAELFDEDGWLRHNDLVEIRPDGHVAFVGRADDVINRGGMKISPTELEAQLVEHPAVGNVVITGVPDKELGYRLCAVVVPGTDADSGEVDLEDLRDFLQRRGVARYKLPEQLILLEDLPTTAAGKLDRRQLAEFAKG